MNFVMEKKYREKGTLENVRKKWKTKEKKKKQKQKMRRKNETNQNMYIKWNKKRKLEHKKMVFRVTVMYAIEIKCWK